MDRIWSNIYRDVIKELDIKLTPMQLEDIFQSQFKFMRETYSRIDIYKEDLPTILIPEIGRFYGKKIKTSKLRVRKQDKIERELNNGKSRTEQGDSEGV